MPDNLFVVKYFELAGTDPVKIVAACETLGIRASEVSPVPAAAAAEPSKLQKTDEEEPPKRRRGRPKKQVESGDDQPKRRGRPPKQKDDEEPPKRRRGRPKKQVEDEAPPKRRSAEPPDDDDDDDAPPEYGDIVRFLKKQGPRRIGDIVEELYLEFGWDKARDIAQVLKSVRNDSKLEDEDFWVVLERICPAGDEDEWLDSLEERIAPHLEDVMGAADDAANGD